MFWAKVTIKGKTSHAGEPEKGSNSIVNAAKLILDLNKSYRNILKRFNSGVHKSTISIGIIKGGENINVVPFKTEILIDRRITSKENIKFSYAHLKSYLNKKFKNVKIEFLTGTNPFKSNPKNIYLLNLIKSYKKIKKNSPKFLSSIGVSDGRYFADDKVNIINVGPGSGDEGHKSNEKLINKELLENYLILKDFLNKLN